MKSTSIFRNKKFRIVMVGLFILVGLYYALYPYTSWVYSYAKCSDKPIVALRRPYMTDWTVGADPGNTFYSSEAPSYRKKIAWHPFTNGPPIYFCNAQLATEAGYVSRDARDIAIHAQQEASTRADYFDPKTTIYKSTYLIDKGYVLKDEQITHGWREEQINARYPYYLARYSNPRYLPDYYEVVQFRPINIDADLCDYSLLEPHAGVVIATINGRWSACKKIGATDDNDPVYRVTGDTHAHVAYLAVVEGTLVSIHPNTSVNYDKSDILQTYNTLRVHDSTKIPTKR